MLNTRPNTGRWNCFCYQIRCPGTRLHGIKPTLLLRTAARKRRVNDTLLMHGSSSLTHNADVWKKNVKPGSIWKENALGSRLTAGKSGAYLSDPVDESDHFNAVTPTVSDDDVPCEEGGEHEIGYLTFPGITLSPLRRPPRHTPDLKYEATDGEEMHEIEAPQVQKLSLTEEIRSQKSTDQNLFDTKLPEDDAWGSGKGLPQEDTLFRLLRRPRRDIRASNSEPSENSSGEEEHPIEVTDKAAEEKTGWQSFFGLMRAASVEEIEQGLVQIAHYKPNVNRVQSMLKELIEVRHVQPQARHYEALILANCEDRHGSADAVYLILAEMEREKMGIGFSTLSAVLKVLSIHPDAQLLPRILQAFASPWSVPASLDTTHLILTLIRLNQFEIALDHLEHLIAVSPPPDKYLRSPIPKFLYLTMLYRLAWPPVSDHTATLHLLYLLNDSNLPISNVCISSILDVAAEALHLDLTLYLWRSHVDTKYMIPSTGLCRNVLLTASRHENSELAAKAGKVLDLRGIAATPAGGSRGGLNDFEMKMIRETLVKDGTLLSGVSDYTLKQTMYEIAGEIGPLGMQGRRSLIQREIKKEQETIWKEAREPLSDPNACGWRKTRVQWQRVVPRPPRRQQTGRRGSFWRVRMDELCKAS
jgi:hypothetical protein